MTPKVGGAPSSFPFNPPAKEYVKSTHLSDFRLMSLVSVGSPPHVFSPLAVLRSSSLLPWVPSPAVCLRSCGANSWSGAPGFGGQEATCHSEESLPTQIANKRVPTLMKQAGASQFWGLRWLVCAAPAQPCTFDSKGGLVRLLTVLIAGDGKRCQLMLDPQNPKSRRSMIKLLKQSANKAFLS